MEYQSKIYALKVMLLSISHEYHHNDKEIVKDALGESIAAIEETIANLEFCEMIKDSEVVSHG